MKRQLRILLCMLGLAGASVAFGQQALLTIVDGSAVLIEGSRRFSAVAGAVVGPGTLIETSDKLNLLRVEWPDGTMADFGPKTSAMLSPHPLARGARSSFYLLHGWAKQTNPGRTPTTGHVTPALQVDAVAGSVLDHAAASGGLVFVESGQATLSDRASGGKRHADLKSGQVYVADLAGKWTAAPRLTPEQMRSVPPGLRETPPAQAARWAGKKVAIETLPAPTYEQLEPWLNAERGLRRVFPDRFAIYARDPAFRSSLDKNLALHPEWTALLHPERLAKPASASH